MSPSKQVSYDPLSKIKLKFVHFRQNYLPFLE